MWQLSFSIFLVLMVAQTLVKRQLAQTQGISATIPTCISYVGAVLPIGVVVGLFLPHRIHWSAWTVMLLLVEGAFIGLFTWLSLLALRYLPTAYFQTLFQASIVVIIALGWALLGEKLTVTQIVGATSVMGAALLAIWAPMRAHSVGTKHIPNLKKGVVLATLCVMFMSIGLVAEKASLQYMDLGAYYIFGFFTQAATVGILAAPSLRRTKLRNIQKTVIKNSLVLGLLSVCMGFAYLVALQQSGNISLITALKAFALPLTAVAAHYILGERDDSRLLWVAIALGTIGVIITTF